MTNKVTILIFSLLLFLPLIVSVRASTNVFSIEPSNEVTQNVECPSGCQSIGGNLSTMSGEINFYVTDPSGSIVANYSNISFLDFNVQTPQNGTYVLHLVNPLSTDTPNQLTTDNMPPRIYTNRQLASRLTTNNVTATLFYARNFLVVLYSTIHMQSSVGYTLQPTPPPPIPWGQIILMILEQLPKIHTLYRQIIPEERPNPLIDDPNEIICLTLVISIVFVSAFPNELRQKNFRSLRIQKDFQRFGLLKETKKTTNKRM